MKHINIDLIGGQFYMYKGSALCFVRSTDNVLRTSYIFEKPGTITQTRLSLDSVNSFVTPLEISPQCDMQEEVFLLSVIHRCDGDREVYTASVPFGFIAQCFKPTVAGIPPEQRSQRILDPKHAIELKNYILSNDDFYLPPMVAHIEGECNFKSLGKNPHNGILTVGIKEMVSSIDGQHRAEAIALLLVDPVMREKYKNHRITVEFLVKLTLPQQQKIFLVLNDTAKGVSKSLCLQYSDTSKDKTINEAIASVPLFRDSLVQKDGDTLTKKSEKAFVYKWLHEASARCKPGNGHDTDFAFLSEFWNTLTEVIPQWKMLNENQIMPCEVRENYLCTHAIAIKAFSELGYRIKDGQALDLVALKNILLSLEGYEWRKESFEGDVVVSGKVISNSTSVKWLADDLQRYIRGGGAAKK